MKRSLIFLNIAVAGSVLAAPRYKFVSLPQPGPDTRFGSAQDGVVSSGYGSPFNPQVIVTTPTESINVFDRFGIVGGPKIKSADTWVLPVYGVPGNPSQQNDGYIYNGKFGRVPPPSWGYETSVRVIGGGAGGWILGGSWVRGGVLRTGAIRYNAATGEMFDNAIGPHNWYSDVNSKGNFLLSASDEQIQSGWTLSWIEKANGDLVELGEGEASFINDHDEVVFSSMNAGTSGFAGIWRNGVRTFFPGFAQGDFRYGEGLSNSGLSLVGALLAGNDKRQYYLYDRDFNRFDVKSIVEGLPKNLQWTSMNIDKKTDQLYFGLRDPITNQLSIGRADPVPEPGTLAALGLGLAAVLRRRRAATN